MKVKSESEVAQSCRTLTNPMDCSLPGSPVHGIFQAGVLEWGAIAFFGRKCFTFLFALHGNIPQISRFSYMYIDWPDVGKATQRTSVHPHRPWEKWSEKQQKQEPHKLYSCLCWVQGKFMFSRFKRAAKRQALGVLRNPVLGPLFFLHAWLLSHVQLFCDLMDCRPPGSSVREILQARILEWIVILFSRGSFWSRDQTWVSCIAGRFFTILTLN